MTEPDWEALRAPFPKADLSVTVTAVKQDKSSKMWSPYVDARAVQDRLDAVVGPANWRVTYVPGPNRQLSDVMALLELRVEGEWICKSDGSDSPEHEPVKGGYSGAIRRAATVWGIARYLYHVDGVWLDKDVPAWEALNHVFPKIPDWAKVPEERKAPEKKASNTRGAAKAEKPEKTAPVQPQAEKDPPPWLVALMAAIDRESFGLDHIRLYLRIADDADWRLAAHAKLQSLSSAGKAGDEYAIERFVEGVKKTPTPREELAGAAR